MNPTIQLKQSGCALGPNEKKNSLYSLALRVLFALMRLLFTGTNDGVPNFSASVESKRAQSVA